MTDEASGRLHFAVASDKLSDGLIVQLEDYLKEYPDSRLIVIDTLQKVRTASKDNAYASDYGDISLIKDFADRQGAAGYERYFEDNEENRYIWSENSVRNILRSPIYAGNLAGYKRIAANMKSKKRPSKLPEEWEVIPNTHEGIVTQEEFDTVQQLMTSRRREIIRAALRISLQALSSVRTAAMPCGL